MFHVHYVKKNIHHNLATQFSIMSDGVHAQLINELLMKLHETRFHTLKHFNKLFFIFTILKHL